MLPLALPLTYLNMGDVFYGDSRIIHIHYSDGTITLDNPVGFHRMTHDNSEVAIVPASPGNEHTVIQIVTPMTPRQRTLAWSRFRRGPCEGVTKTGKPCKRAARGGEDGPFCGWHRKRG